MPLLTELSYKESFFREMKKSGFEKQIKLNEPLKNHTSYRIGGPVDFYYVPENIDELKRIFSVAVKMKIPYKFIGNGTNLLIRDKGLKGIVMQLGKGFKNITQSGRILKAGAGVSLPSISQYAFKQNLSGLEFSINIPGTLGGAIINNASFRGNSISDIIRNITILTPENRIIKITKNNLKFRYRSCEFGVEKFIITKVELELAHGKKENIISKMEKNKKFRLNKQPVNGYNAGSIFKNPAGFSAGALIDKAGAKGLRKGNAEVSNVHANFIINRGNASANDILHLIREIEKRIEEKYRIHLEREIEIIGIE